MTDARSNRRSGATMLEIVIAAALLGGLVAAALSALTYASKPAAEASIRAYAVTQGGQTMLRLVGDLEGASYANPTTAVGTFSGTTFTPSGLTSGLTYQDGSTADGYEGTAVRFDVITGWNGAPVLDAGGPFVYYFTSDASTGALKLVRVGQGGAGLKVDLLTDIEAGAAFRKPAADANLHIDFAVSRAVGFDHATNTVERGRAAFHQEVNLRNLNQ